MKQVVTRFAPSPTGYMHIGGLRTALYSYLYAKQNSGKFILRYEDTDQKRLVTDSRLDILNTLQMFDMNPDQIYVQSERLLIYQYYANELVNKGFAYRCFCHEGEECNCYSNDSEDFTRTMLHNQNRNFTIKLKISEIVDNNDNITFTDKLRGDIIWNVKDLYDIILMKSDGFPTYHLASVVDDYLMEITDVFRGEEWLSSTPYHVGLYKAFNWQEPTFIHLPLILNVDGTKLSKRHGDFSVKALLDNNILPSAILNYIALLGWHPSGNDELFSKDELLKLFSVDRLSLSSACFDEKKLKKFNLIYAKTDVGKLEFFTYLMKDSKYTKHFISKLYDIFYNSGNIDIIKSFRQPKTPTSPEYDIEITDQYNLEFFEDFAYIVEDIQFTYNRELLNSEIDYIIQKLKKMYTNKDIQQQIRLYITGNTVGYPVEVLLSLLTPINLHNIIASIINVVGK